MTNDTSSVPPKKNHFEQSISQLNPSLQREMQELRKQETAIMKVLSDPQKAEQYLSNPLEVLRNAGINMPPLLKARLQAFDPTLADQLKRQTYALPNGQTITARITVRFTQGPKEI